MSCGSRHFTGQLRETFGDHELVGDVRGEDVRGEGLLDCPVLSESDNIGT